jgi:biotin carboxyl carrier protein
MSARRSRPTGKTDGRKPHAPVDKASSLLEPAEPPVDPRAVRVTVAAATRAEDDPTLTVAPPPVPVVRPLEHLAGTAILGGVPSPAARPPGGDGRGRMHAGRSAAEGAPTQRRPPARDGSEGSEPLPASGPDADGGPGAWPGELMVEGEPRRAGVVPQGREHAILVEVEGGRQVETRLVLGPERRRESDGVVVREVVVDGWRVEVELEPERRASLRERARRASDVVGRSGPVEVHAIIPGRIVALSVAPGDAVVAGQQLLVLEAMKMQNELRAPREGSIERIPIAVGENVEVGDLLMVIS